MTTRETNLIDLRGLLEEAKKSEHRESYAIIERNKNYRIGVGVQLAQSGQPSFLVEILVSLFSGSSVVDLLLLEKSLMFLKDLKARGYFMSYEGDNFVCCYKVVTPENLAAECDAIKPINERTLRKK